MLRWYRSAKVYELDFSQGGGVEVVTMSDDDEVQRLRQMYAGLSDAELLKLARGRDELLPAGQQALDAEIEARGLVPAEEAAAPAAADEAEDAALDPTEVRLTRFGITADLETAMNALEASSVAFRVEKVAATNAAGRPTDAVDMYVAREQQGQAVHVLRKELGLFPLPEVDRRAESDGDLRAEEEELFSVADFESDADAAVARQALTQAGIYFREERAPAEADPETGSATGEVILFEVRFDDMERAVEVIGHAFPQEPESP